MSKLQKLAEGRTPSLKAHVPHRSEIANHLARAGELLDEASIKRLSERSRFNSYYESCHQSCLAGLKLAGYRPAEGLGHRQIAFQAVEHALPISKPAIVAMAEANSLRGKTEYDAALFDVSHALLDAIAGAARELLDEARIQLKRAKTS